MHMCVFIYTVNIVTNPVHALPFAHHQMSSCLYIDSHTTPEHVSGAERGAERAKYSRSAERVFNQRPERSLCLAPVPLRYRSHHEPRACTNPPRMLHVDFPFRTYVNRLEQPHCLRNTRVSGAVQPHRNLGPATE